jgi:hypothetical protein
MTSDSLAPQTSSDYPVSLDIEYVDADRNKATTFFRVVMAIPIIAVQSGLAALLWPQLLMILFRQKYPRWWFDFNVEVTRFSTRISAYISLLTDQYPATDEEQSVRLNIDYPDATQLNRWLPLIKWILLIPHYIVLSVLLTVAIIMIIVGWFAILFTGRLPRGIHNYLVGVTRWSTRVNAYGFLLTTDIYPPFSLD